MPSRTTALAERIAANIKVNDRGCWIWQGGTTSNGYGAISASNRTRRVHRVAYEVFRGPIPDGLEPDHLCRERRCCNPDHLEAVTHRENVLRSPGSNGTKTHCPQGHPYSGANLYIDPKGYRYCRSCQNARRRARRLRDRQHGLLS